MTTNIGAKLVLPLLPIPTRPPAAQIVEYKKTFRSIYDLIPNLERIGKASNVLIIIYTFYKVPYILGFKKRKVSLGFLKHFKNNSTYT